MWQIARYYGIPTRKVDLLRNWFICISSFVRIDGEEGDLFPLTTGLRQGWVMSPPSFNIYMDAMMMFRLAAKEW